MDPEDVDVQRPDEKSILTYIARQEGSFFHGLQKMLNGNSFFLFSSYYHTFSKLNEGQRGGKKINAIVTKIKRIEEQKEQFELDSKALLR